MTQDVAPPLRVLGPFRAPPGSHCVACSSSPSPCFSSLCLSLCLFLSLLLLHCGNISFSLVRILISCFLQAHLIFPVLLGIFFLNKQKMERLMEAFYSFFWKRQKACMKERGKGLHKSKSHKLISQNNSHIQNG